MASSSSSDAQAAHPAVHNLSNQPLRHADSVPNALPSANAKLARLQASSLPNLHHHRFMTEAISESKANLREKTGGPFGAVIVRNGEIVARGNNRVTRDLDPTSHAEVVAIRNACKALNSFQLTDCELYTSCEPCPMCLGAIYWARLKAVYYGNTRADAAKIGFDDDFIYRELDKPLEERSIPMVQMLSEQAWEAFAGWAAKTDKIEY